MTSNIIVERGSIEVTAPTNPYDELVARFIRASPGLKLVFMSGYCAIALGRSRQTEDIDLFVEVAGATEFQSWWSSLDKAGFWCINAVTRTMLSMSFRTVLPSASPCREPSSPISKQSAPNRPPTAGPMQIHGSSSSWASMPG